MHGPQTVDKLTFGSLGLYFKKWIPLRRVGRKVRSDGLILNSRAPHTRFRKAERLFFSFFTG